MNCFMERLAFLSESSQFDESLPLQPINQANVQVIQKYVTNPGSFNGKKIQRISSSLSKALSLSRKEAKIVAIAIDRLLAIYETGFCYYMKRKMVPLPRGIKIIIDKRYSLAHLVPKKDPQGEFDGSYKCGRPVCSLMVEENAVLVNNFWSLTPKKDGEWDYKMFSSVRGFEKRLERVIPDRVAKCYFDYDYVLRSYKDVPKRMALYEYYDAKDLFSFLVSFAPTEKAPLRYALFQQIVAALAELHRNNIVWMDPKPENIVVKKGTKNDGSDWQVAFCDFDFSVDLNGERPESAAYLGSSVYMSPELMMTALREEWNDYSDSETHEEDFPYSEYMEECPPVNLSSDDLRPNDVYSLGVASLVLLTGFLPPWGGLEEGEMFAEKMAHRYHPRLKKATSEESSATTGDATIFSHTMQEGDDLLEKMDKALIYIAEHMLCPNPRNRATMEQVLLFLQN